MKYIKYIVKLVKNFFHSIESYVELFAYLIELSFYSINLSIDYIIHFYNLFSPAEKIIGCLIICFEVLLAHHYGGLDLVFKYCEILHISLIFVIISLLLRKNYTKVLYFLYDVPLYTLFFQTLLLEDVYFNLMVLCAIIIYHFELFNLVIFSESNSDVSMENAYFSIFILENINFWFFIWYLVEYAQNRYYLSQFWSETYLDSIYMEEKILFYIIIFHTLVCLCFEKKLYDLNKKNKK